MTKLLTKEFLDKYDDFPKHMNPLGQFVYLRTYSRYLPDKGRRETWKETVQRAVEYNVGLGVKHAEKVGLNDKSIDFKTEAEALFDSMFNLRQFLSGRTLWVGGAEGGVADKYPLANYNCSFVEITKWEDFADMFYLLLVGSGVGFRSTKDTASKLPPVNTNIKVIHNEYVQRYPIVQQDSTQVFEVEEEDGIKHVIHVGDSKEGWVESLRAFLKAFTDASGNVKTISIHYDYVRPKGTRLKTFGGTASGHEPLQAMFEGIEQVFNNELDPFLDDLEKDEKGFSYVRPIHVLDIGNLIGNNVVVGGVRRTAELFMMDENDYESIFAKYGINGIWDVEQHEKVIGLLREQGLDKQADYLASLETFNPNARPLHHRRMSNNSIAFEKKPDKEWLDTIFEIMRAEGEPGFVNMEEAKRRRPNAKGLNPCVEIVLDSYGVCNLTTVNVDAFVMEDGTVDVEGLVEAQKLSARAGLRMTLVTLELPHWDEVQQRDRLLGTSLTGFKDASGRAKMEEEDEQQLLITLRDASRDEARDYAYKMRVNEPLLVTTVKPEGTLSQVAGGVSSGLHYSHAPYYIRRIRINAQDPLAKAVKDMGWTVHAEVGTEGQNDVEELAEPELIEKARTLVIDFPVKSGATKTNDDTNVKEQFDNYFNFQTLYAEHNSSNTISLRPDEWMKASDIVFEGWDDFVGVSFLAHDGGSYNLAPYEAITEEEYETLVSEMEPLDHTILEKYEDGIDAEMDELMSDCEGGACPVR